ncbi:hypothetical protein VKT23_001616 [Stygiomarasmius scandens]|uniref:Uncharacterized protein n=1 Tax=Marasmiellus scandens TaxID=2682957 RepID=A0ABR1K4Y5_9AGAR
MLVLLFCFFMGFPTFIYSLPWNYPTVANISIKAGGSSWSASSSSNGGGDVSTIPSGNRFAGRRQGGGTRNDVYGTSEYPGEQDSGVSGRGFPFYFWPIVWDDNSGDGETVLQDMEVYGSVNDPSRPGGPLIFTAFSLSSQAMDATFYIVSDNATVLNIAPFILESCINFLDLSRSGQSYHELCNSSINSTSAPSANSVIQYYRASSVALTLSRRGDSDMLKMLSPFPSFIDALACVNSTIGNGIILVNNSAASPREYLVVLLVFVLVAVIALFVYMVCSDD